jgi:hypothetical protein
MADVAPSVSVETDAGHEAAPLAATAPTPDAAQVTTDPVMVAPPDAGAVVTVDAAPPTCAELLAASPTGVIIWMGMYISVCPIADPPLPPLPSVATCAYVDVPTDGGDLTAGYGVGAGMLGAGGWCNGSQVGWYCNLDSQGQARPPGDYPTAPSLGPIPCGLAAAAPQPAEGRVYCCTP